MQEASGYPRLLWVLMITSAQNRGWPGDVTIPDPAAAGLPAPSIVRTAKIATIEAEDAECIGRLQRNEQLQVALSLRDKLDSILAASN
jgi:mRNA interferase MazF